MVDTCSSACAPLPHTRHAPLPRPRGTVAGCSYCRCMPTSAPAPQPPSAPTCDPPHGQHRWFSPLWGVGSLRPSRARTNILTRVANVPSSPAQVARCSLEPGARYPQAPSGNDAVERGATYSNPPPTHNLPLSLHNDPPSLACATLVRGFLASSLFPHPRGGRLHTQPTSIVRLRHIHAHPARLGTRGSTRPLLHAHSQVALSARPLASQSPGTLAPCIAHAPTRHHVMPAATAGTPTLCTGFPPRSRTPVRQRPVTSPAHPTAQHAARVPTPRRLLQRATASTATGIRWCRLLAHRQLQMRAGDGAGTPCSSTQLPILGSGGYLTPPRL